jgi:hypothetical protein
MVMRQFETEQLAIAYTQGNNESKRWLFDSKKPNLT